MLQKIEKWFDSNLNTLEVRDRRNWKKIDKSVDDVRRMTFELASIVAEQSSPRKNENVQKYEKVMEEEQSFF